MGGAVGNGSLRPERAPDELARRRCRGSSGTETGNRRKAGEFDALLLEPLCGDRVGEGPVDSGSLGHGESIALGIGCGVWRR
jgi:hypothetical protein